jgi:peptide/nickel transport system permease protein
MKKLLAGTTWEVPYLKFRRNGIAVAALIILVLLYAALFFEGPLAPHAPDTKFKEKSYHPPHRVHFFHEDRFIGPFVYEYEMVNPFFKQYVVDRSRIHPLGLFVRGDPYVFLLFRADIHFFGTTDGSPLYLLGADNLGRDLLSRIIYGSRVSLTIGFVSIFIALFGGIIIGGLSGLLGGFTDWVIMRITEIIILLPTFYLFLFLRSIMPTDVPPEQKFLLLTMIFAVPGWAGSARGIRNWVLSLKNTDYVTSAVISGVPRLAVISRHIIPQIRHLLILTITLSVPGIILGEAGLSFLNLGITEPSVSWGMLMASANDVNILFRYPWVLSPAIVIVLTVFCFFSFAFGLKDALDPRSQLGSSS